jgi:hypothetical protein
MSMTIEPNEVALLEKAFREYREGTIDLEALQWTLAVVEGLVHSYEDRAFRDELRWAEGEIEMIRFTVDSSREQSAALDVIKTVEQELPKHLHS